MLNKLRVCHKVPFHPCAWESGSCRLQHHFFQKFLHIQLVHLLCAADLQRKAFPLVSIIQNQREAVGSRTHPQNEFSLFKLKRHSVPEQGTLCFRKGAHIHFLHMLKSGLTEPAHAAATLIFLPHSFCIQLRNLVEIPTICKIKCC